MASVVSGGEHGRFRNRNGNLPCLGRQIRIPALEANECAAVTGLVLQGGQVRAGHGGLQQGGVVVGPSLILFYAHVADGV
eukprot:CAMPEP_0170496054 /NCGR_PEP_ID=MMETSP0208-20121228/19843_1 /TAXON_ID=197538 /ORGANISM="Strombidium inclinatum, Strain S3" /LENGTH=79 /DNA_ID=CAMNT_0010772483 /DNA_START=403 /DNA_END=642 /DNA_ORIENTATION=+